MAARVSEPPFLSGRSTRLKRGKLRAKERTGVDGEEGRKASVDTFDRIRRVNCSAIPFGELRAGIRISRSASCDDVPSAQDGVRVRRDGVDQAQQADSKSPFLSGRSTRLKRGKLRAKERTGVDGEEGRKASVDTFDRIRRVNCSAIPFGELRAGIRISRPVPWPSGPFAQDGWRVEQ